MALTVGIVGLPNVGKFQHYLMQLCAGSKQRTICLTIDPNVGVVEVPDLRLQKPTEISETKEKLSQRHLNLQISRES